MSLLSIVLVTTCNVETGNCVLHLDRSAARITGCLNDNTSQCYTEPEINFGRNVLQCTWVLIFSFCLLLIVFQTERQLNESIDSEITYFILKAFVIHS